MPLGQAVQEIDDRQVDHVAFPLRIAEHLHDVGALLDEPVSGRQRDRGVARRRHQMDIHSSFAQGMHGHGDRVRRVRRREKPPEVRG